MLGLASSVLATFRARLAATSSRSRSMSMYASVAFLNSGYERMSPVRFFEKTTLPAPMKATLITAKLPCVPRLSERAEWGQGRGDPTTEVTEEKTKTFATDATDEHR